MKIFTIAVNEKEKNNLEFTLAGNISAQEAFMLLQQAIIAFERDNAKKEALEEKPKETKNE